MSPLRLFIAWIWVAVPLSWGVYQSVNKSMPLFGLGAAASPAPVTTPAPAK